MPKYLKPVPGSKPVKSGKGTMMPVGAPSMRQDKSYQGKAMMTNKMARYKGKK